MTMPKKGNGLDLTNEYLHQILGKLGEVLVSQEAMRKEQEAMRVQMGNIEDAVRQIASFVGQERVRHMQEFEDLKRRVEILEHKAA